MHDAPLHTLLAATLLREWEATDDGWRCDASLDDGALPVALALTPLGSNLDAPLVATVTVPLPVHAADARRADTLWRAWSADHAPVGTLEVVGGHGRFRLAHDPAVAPFAPDVVHGLARAATAWADALLPRALRVLILGGVRLDVSDH